MELIKTTVIASMLILSFFVLFFSQEAVAAVSEVHGLALVRVKSAHIDLELEQIVLANKDEIFFQAIDDFGNAVFEVVVNQKGVLFYGLKKQHKLKKILSLPLTAEEFRAIWLYQPQELFSVVREADTVVWRKKAEKKLQIVFSDFIKTKRGYFPGKVHISCKKNQFDLKWIRIKKIN